MITQKRFDSNIYWLYALLLFSVDTVLFGTNSQRVFLFVPRIIGVVFCIFVFALIVLSNTYQTKAKKMYLPFMVFVLILTVSFLINNDDLSTYISRLISITVGMGIAILYDSRRFTKGFLSFMFFIGGISLVAEVLAYIYPSIFNIFPTVINSANSSFKCFLVGSVRLSELGGAFIRNNSIFWEPGAFAIYLIFSLGLELYCNDDISLKRVVVFLLCIVSTFSTTGYICVTILLVGYIFKKNAAIKNNKQIKGVLICFLSGAVIFVLLDNLVLYDYVFGKMVNLDSSAVTRFSSFFNGIKVALQHPLFGVGSNTYIHMKQIIYDTHSRFSSGGYIITNTLVGNAASYGLIFATLFIYGMVRGIKKTTKNNYSFWIITLTMCLAYCGEKFFSFFPFILVFYGFRNDMGTKE